MGMFFNSWKDEDADAYWGCGDASGHYYRGYDDGRDSAKEEYKNKIDKAYKKGFEAGRKKAVEELMRKLIDLFGKEVDFPHLIIQKVIEDKMIEELSDDDEMCTATSLDSDALDEPVNVDSLDDDVLEPQGNDDVVNEIMMEPDYPIK